MWYTGAEATGYVGDIGYAESPVERIPLEYTLYKFPLNPVFKGVPGKFDSQNTSYPDIIFHENQYNMWYSGYDGGAGSRVGFAVSDDGIKWDRHDGPVLQTGSGDSWDNYSVQQTSVLFDGTTWHMWYVGLRDGDLSTRKIGYATSEDKINWTKYESNPVLEPGSAGSWDDQWVGWPRVLFIDGQYHMWYTSDNGTVTQIGHATSEDGINWEKDSSNPVLTVGEFGAWDDNVVSNPDLIYDGYTFHMWYCGARTVFGDWKVGYAVSLDGRNWQKISVEAPVLDLGSAGDWDDKTSAAGVIVIPDANTGELKMWYGGGRSINSFNIGYASSDSTFGEDPPAAYFAADSTTGENPLTVQFSDSSSGLILNWFWDFGDGETSTEQNPLHTYTTADTFSVSLTVSGPGGSGSKTMENYIIVQDSIETGIINNAIDMPDKFALQQNFPNPFNPMTTIQYQIGYTVGTQHAVSQHIDLSIYNLLGQKVATLVNKKQQAGNYSVTWNASGFTSGIYFYKLETNTGFVRTRKLLLLK